MFGLNINLSFDTLVVMTHSVLWKFNIDVFEKRKKKHSSEMQK